MFFDVTRQQFQIAEVLGREKQNPNISNLYKIYIDRYFSSQFLARSNSEQPCNANQLTGAIFSFSFLEIHCCFSERQQKRKVVVHILFQGYYRQENEPTF